MLYCSIYFSKLLCSCSSLLSCYLLSFVFLNRFARIYTQSFWSLLLLLVLLLLPLLLLFMLMLPLLLLFVFRRAGTTTDQDGLYRGRAGYKNHIKKDEAQVGHALVATPPFFYLRATGRRNDHPT